MNIDDYLNIIKVKHVNKNIDYEARDLINNKIIDSISHTKTEYIKIKKDKKYYILNTYYFDVITIANIDPNVSIIIDNKEIKNIINLTIPIISLNSKIYIKLDINTNIKIDSDTKLNANLDNITITYKGYILNNIPILEFTKYYNKNKINNNNGLTFFNGLLYLNDNKY